MDKSRKKSFYSVESGRSTERKKSSVTNTVAVRGSVNMDVENESRRTSVMVDNTEYEGKCI